jgi:secernin
VCDTVCVLGNGVTLFAKNSDRPMAEPQVVAAVPRRQAGGRLRTQYVDIPDAGAVATVLSRPVWLWGAEHGVNEHRVAIGNEKVFTVDDPRQAPPALIGMDLVRLGLERGRTAEEALQTMTALLERHGQGGVGDDVHDSAYWSSFVIADPVSAWVLETSGRRWAARPVTGGVAISNRLTLGRDWTRASADVPGGTDIDDWRHPSLPTGFADARLAAGRAFVERACAAGGPGCDPRAAVGALRDHGGGPWGAPVAGGSGASGPGGNRSGAGTPMAAPADIRDDGTGWTLCLHAVGVAVTTASMVAELPADPRCPARAWMALGCPCVSVYVPVPLPSAAQDASLSTDPVALPAVVKDVGTWRRLAAVRDAVGCDAGALAAVRVEMSRLEEALWDEADTLDGGRAGWEAFGDRATSAVGGALDRLAASGLGVAGGAGAA